MKPKDHHVHETKYANDKTGPNLQQSTVDIDYYYCP